MTGLGRRPVDAAGAAVGCGNCEDLRVVPEVAVVADGVLLERAVQCPACRPSASRRQLVRDRSTGNVGVVMWSSVVLGPAGLVTKYVLRPEGGGLEWPATDVESLDAEPLDASAPERQVRA